ncbi:MAG: M42 family metallopeptidase [Elusimicrobia bacterium]|nr:M42 family metallopeptidase [Elusimicrobiota bacterium]
MKNERVVEFLRELEAVASPSGLTGEIIALLEGKLSAKGLKTRVTNKGALVVSAHPEPYAVVAGHVDTLGAMVSRIEGDGTLRVAMIGGWPIPSFEGEYVSVRTASGRAFRGTFLFDNPAAHVNKEVGKTERTLDNTHVRLDAETTSSKETAGLKVAIGDYVCFDPRFEVTDTGFIKSRFLDDKAGTAAMLEVIERLGPGLKALPIAFFFSNYEEVGHGAPAGFPPTAKEMLVVDMGVIGKTVAGRETSVSICAKDSSGPQDYELRCRLAALAKKGRIPFAVDVFPFYSSDAAMALQAGLDLRAGIIGPGVSASHGVERTHLKGLKATADLLEAYCRDIGNRTAPRKARQG